MDISRIYGSRFRPPIQEAQRRPLGTRPIDSYRAVRSPAAVEPLFLSSTLRASNDRTTPNERRFRDRVKKWWFPSTVALMWIPNIWYAVSMHFNQGKDLPSFIKVWGDYMLAPLKTLPFGLVLIGALLLGPPIYFIWSVTLKKWWWNPSVKRLKDATEPARHEDYVAPVGHERWHEYLPESVEDRRQLMAKQGFFEIGITGRLLRTLRRGSKEEKLHREIRQGLFDRHPDWKPKGDD